MKKEADRKQNSQLVILGGGAIGSVLAAAVAVASVAAVVPIQRAIRIRIADGLRRIG